MENNTETKCQVESNVIPESKNELDDLLSSALADFEQIPVVKSTSKDKNAISMKDASLVQNTSSFTTKPQNLEERDLESAFYDVLGTSKPMDSSATISEAVKKISESTQDIETDVDMSDIDTRISDMLQQFDLGGQNLGSGTLLPFMEDTLQMFLCKDLLCPAMVEIRDKYPAWLENNKSALSSDDFSRYSKQYDLVKEICIEFESEKDTDPEDVKNKRFKILLDLMQKINECGEPPKELVSDNLPGVDANGMPKIPAQMVDPQCPVS